MLKRLLIAVLVLGLVVALGGTAFSENPKVDRVEKSVLHPTAPVNPSSKVATWPFSQTLPASHRPISGPVPVEDNSGNLHVASVDTTSCGITDYALAGPYYSVKFAGDWGEGMAMSFDVPPQYRAEVYQVGIRCYGVFGTPTLTISVHADNAGVPGTVIASFPFTPVVGNILYTLPSTVNVPEGTGSYWISAIVTGAASDTMQIGITGNGGSPTGRGRYYMAGWTTILAAFGTDYDARIAANQCFFYSECYSNVIDPRGMYSIPIPEPGFAPAILNGIAQRFVAEGPETLNAVKVMTVDNTGSGSPAKPPHYLYGPTSTNGLVVSVWADSLGYIDKSTGPLHTATLAGGLANIYPVTNNDGSALPIRRDTAIVPFPFGTVLAPGPYHITVQMSSDNIADGAVYFRYAIDGTYGGGSVNFTAPLAEWDRTATNPDFGPGYGLVYDGNWDIRPQLCADEFKVCATKVLYDAPDYYVYSVRPDPTVTNGRVAVAQKIKGIVVNRIDKMRFLIDFNGAGTAGINASIWASTPSGPGALLYSQAVPSPTFWPGWTEVVIPGGYQVVGDFYVGWTPIFPNPGDVTDFLYQYSEDSGSPPSGHPHAMQNGGVWDMVDDGVNPPYWRSFAIAAGYDDNFMFEVDMCSIPPTERACGVEDNWPTLAHDFNRTSASINSIGDAYCDLTLNWSHFRDGGAGLVTADNGPIIWDGNVICAYRDGIQSAYVITDLATGAILQTISTVTNFDQIGGDARCTPSVYEVGGVPYLFLSAGIPGGMSAWDVSTIPATMVWSADLTNSWNGLAPLDMGNTRYGTVVVVNVGGTDVVYWTDDNNFCYAADATDGTPFWAGPVNLGMSAQKSITTDGANLYFSQFTLVGNGDVKAISCGTGANVWNLAATGGLQASALGTGVTFEYFLCGPTYDASEGTLFVNSQSDGNSPAGGVLYKLNAGTGAIIWDVLSMRAVRSHMMLDAITVIVPTVTRWIPHPLGGDLVCFDKRNGAQVWAAASFPQTASGGGLSGLQRIFNEGVLTCEPDAPDYAIAFSEAGYLGFFNSNNGDEVFHRRIDYAVDANRGGMGAVGTDVDGDLHVVFVDAQGGLYDLEKTNVDRPRLELLQPSPVYFPVPFGSLYDTPITFADIYTNTGCTDLLVSLTASTTSNGTTPPSPARGNSFKMVRDQIAHSASSIADRLTKNSHAFVMATALTDDVNAPAKEATTRSIMNRAALATPFFLIENGTYPGDVFIPANGNIVTAPGDTSGITVRVDGPAISRGPQCFFVEFTTINDPDYYLNDVAMRPEMQLCLVGGCLTDTTFLSFGAGGANTQIVCNMGRVAMADWTPYGIEIDGSADILFAGTYVYGVDSIRIAMNAVPWQSGSTEPQAWISMQGDPNFCDGSCKPALQTGVSLGDATADGLTYFAVSGDLVCKSYIDSVQNFDDGAGGWDWELAQPRPFDAALTMGLYVNTRTIGVTDAPAVVSLLNNMTLEIMEFQERNGDSVKGWYFGANFDHDMNVVDDPAATGTDSAAIDRNHSVGWAFTRGATNTTVAGMVKVPFGCGYDALRVVKRMSSQQSMFDPLVDWDSMYYDMSLAPGFYAQVANFEASDDEQVRYGIATKDFGPNDTTSFGVANFALSGIANPTTSAGNIAALADLVNKWAGFGRGDVNNDGGVNLADIIYLADYINFGPGKPGPIPFKHIGDVDASGGLPNLADVTFLVNYYFNHGACPKGDWAF